MSKKTNNNGGNLIVRHKARGYVAIPSAIFYDDEVDGLALGVYSKIMALPDDWNFTVKGLVATMPNGEDAIRAALRRLQEHGWVSYIRRHDDKGRITGTEWHIYDQKLSYIKKEDCPHTENPDMDNPHTENPDVEKPHEENPAQFKLTMNNNLQSNTHTHTADGSPEGGEEKKLSDEDQRVIDSVKNFIHDKCTILELRFEPLSDKQILYLHNKLNIGLQDIAKYLMDIQSKYTDFVVGASLCRLVEKFHENDFTLRRKKK